MAFSKLTSLVYPVNGKVLTMNFLGLMHFSLCSSPKHKAYVGFFTAILFNGILPLEIELSKFNICRNVSRNRTALIISERSIEAILQR